MASKITRKEGVIKLISRSSGATIEQIQKETGWQPHSVRAALTGLRKDGHQIERSRNSRNVSVYRIAAGETS